MCHFQYDKWLIKVASSYTWYVRRLQTACVACECHHRAILVFLVDVHSIRCQLLETHVNDENSTSITNYIMYQFTMTVWNPALVLRVVCYQLVLKLRDEALTSFTTDEHSYRFNRILTHENLQSTEKKEKFGTTAIRLGCGVYCPSTWVESHDANFYSGFSILKFSCSLQTRIKRNIRRSTRRRQTDHNVLVAHNTCRFIHINVNRLSVRYTHLHTLLFSVDRVIVLHINNLWHCFLNKCCSIGYDICSSNVASCVFALASLSYPLEWHPIVDDTCDGRSANKVCIR